MISQDLFQAMSRFQKINQPVPGINTLLHQFSVLVSPTSSAHSFSAPKLPVLTGDNLPLHGKSNAPSSSSPPF